jgi:hypothetical protein
LEHAEPRPTVTAPHCVGGLQEGFDYDSFNASEQARLAGLPPDRLLADPAAAREATIVCVAGLEEADPPTSPGHRLDRMGRHPTLREITLEAHTNAIYGHQLRHMRDVQRLLE